MHPPTIFLDIDGTIFKHQKSLSNILTNDAILIDGTINKLNEWERLGCRIILTTGRKESQRLITEKQLCELGIFYDQLIMGIGGGPRYLINDRKGDGKDMAFSINLDRDYGISDVKLN